MEKQLSTRNQLCRHSIHIVGPKLIYFFASGLLNHLKLYCSPLFVLKRSCFLLKINGKLNIFGKFKMNNYTSIEMLDTHFLYGVAGDNKARRLSIEQYPNRLTPCTRTFIAIHNRRGETGFFQVSMKNIG